MRGGAAVRVLSPVVLALCAGLLSAGAARAEEKDDDFDTNWLGARIGLWYRPSIDMKMQVNGRPKLPGGGQVPLGFAVLVGDRIDIEDDLGVKQTVQSDYMFNNAILEGEVFMDSRWVSLSLWGIAPFEYRGDAPITRSFNFGGQTFSATLDSESRFRQWFAGLDLKFNILNNKIIALSPILGLRAFAIDWEIKGKIPATGQVVAQGDTSDIDSPLKIGDDQLIPYPVLGAEIKVGIRRWVEADLKVVGLYVSYGEVEGGSVQADAGLTFWPIPYLGLRVGGRYATFQFETKSQDKKDSFDFDLDYLGANISLIVRI